MSDFEEGFVVGYVFGKKHFSTGKKYDPIFHDILKNSEAFCTIIIDDVYKFTLNLWAPMRSDVPYSNSYSLANLTAAETEGVGYSQTVVTHSKSVQTYKILWKNDKPMYAAFAQNSFLHQSFKYVELPANYDSGIPFKYYAYYDSTYEYIKGSAAANCDPVLHIKPAFHSSMSGTRFLRPEDIYFVDSDGNTVRPGCTYKLKCKTYKAVFDETDHTKLPKIVLDKEGEETLSIAGTGFSTLSLSSCSDSESGAIYSDLPENKLDSLTDELMKTICEKYGDRSCYTHIPAEWLVPNKG